MITVHAFFMDTDEYGRWEVIYSGEDRSKAVEASRIWRHSYSATRIEGAIPAIERHEVWGDAT